LAELAAPVTHLSLWVPNALLPQGWLSWRLGGSPPRPISSGTGAASMVARTAAAWHFISGTSWKGCCSVRAAAMRRPLPRAGDSSIGSPRASGSIPRSPTRSTPHRGMQARAAPGAVRTMDPRGLDRIGPRGE
jgi:hypothetical protein